MQDTIYNPDLLEVKAFTSIHDFKNFPSQKMLLNINPQFLEDDDQFKSKSFNNMRFFYGKYK